MTSPNPRIWTIGHSNQSLDAFVALLQQHDVTAVADVRSAPYSRFTPQFNREALQRGLRDVGIKYVFLGRELGARSDDPTCYENGQVQYARLALTEPFRKGVDRLVRGAREYRIAIMCAEKDPLECHRTLLVARALVSLDVSVDHILSNGQAESHEAAMIRLLALVGLPQVDLFRSHEELIREGLSRQEARIAYVDDGRVAESGRRMP